MALAPTAPRCPEAAPGPRPDRSHRVCHPHRRGRGSSPACHSHLDEIERLLIKGGEAGKRLDFLIQELHREANTLGSPSPAALELTRVSVDMKVLIEQMREQVQDIE
jgi:hypothetical protein